MLGKVVVYLLFLLLPIMAIQHTSDFINEDGSMTSYTVNEETVMRKVIQQDPNYGDMWHLDRQYGDKLLERKLIATNVPALKEEFIKFDDIYPEFNITHIFGYNVGKQHGYIYYIRSNWNGDVECKVRVNEGEAVRVFFDIYGRPRDYP